MSTPAKLVLTVIVGLLILSATLVVNRKPSASDVRAQQVRKDCYDEVANNATRLYLSTGVTASANQQVDANVNCITAHGVQP